MEKINTIINSETYIKPVKAKKLIEKIMLKGSESLRKLSLQLHYCNMYREYAITEKTNESRISNMVTCKNKLCPICSSIKTKRDNEILAKTVELLKNDGYKILFLTLNVKNCKPNDLDKTVKMLSTGWLNMKKLVNYKNYLGTCKRLEVKPSTENNTFNAHLHILVAVKKDYYVPQEQMILDWKQSCKLNYNPSVYIETVEEESINGVAKYLSKYLVKSEDFLTNVEESRQIEILETMNSQLKGHRMLTYAGIFNTYKKEAEKLLEEQLEKLELERLTDPKTGEIQKEYFVVTKWNVELEKYEVISINGKSVCEDIEKIVELEKHFKKVRGEYTTGLWNKIKGKIEEVKLPKLTKREKEIRQKYKNTYYSYLTFPKCLLGKEEEKFLQKRREIRFKTLGL